MRKFSKESADYVRRLAASYHEYTKLRVEIFEKKNITHDNVMAFVIWTGCLKLNQTMTGVYMHENKNMDMLAYYAKQLLAEKSAPSIVEVV